MEALYITFWERGRLECNDAYKDRYVAKAVARKELAPFVDLPFCVYRQGHNFRSCLTECWFQEDGLAHLWSDLPLQTSHEAERNEVLREMS